MTTTDISTQPVRRDWIICTEKHCEVMADRPHPRLVDIIKNWSSVDFLADYAWLEEHLTRVSGPPGMELRPLNVAEMQLGATGRPQPIEYYGVLLRVPMPDSNNPANLIPVGRLGYSYAAAIRDEAMLWAEVRNVAAALVMHEIDEWYRIDGEYFRKPHPEVA